MTPFLAGLGLILAGAFTAGAGARSRAAHVALILAGSGLGIAAAVAVLVSGVAPVTTIPASIPGGDWHLGVDALSATFLIAILGVGAACAAFGAWDSRDERHGTFVRAAFPVLVASIALVVIARSVTVFLAAWEVMAISSYVLIVAHYEDASVRRAGLIYLVATHAATLALYAMFAAWGGDADWSFAALSVAAPGLSGPRTTVILLLALVGFGFKAGAVPFHIWLPPAHAAAPSHVSALMSGIVIKTGIYGLFRVLILLGGAPAWWGWLVFGIGIASGVLGVLWALAQHDIKRLLAYHSVENIGIILMGTGVGVLGVAHGLPAVAALGFAGAVLHTVNHALFKSLLFLGAGAVYRATGTRHMEALGGLARRMPLTWLGFAIGAAAIIGVPPLNGFVSEWLVFQGMFGAADASRPLMVALVGAPALALIGALALACFAKVAGVVFLGTPRSQAVDAATESAPGWIPMLALAGACVALGAVPRLGLAYVLPAARQLTPLPGASLPEATVAAATALAMLAMLVALIAVVLFFAKRLADRRRVVTAAPTWACGYEAVTPRMQYTATSFAAPLVGTFGGLSGVRVERSRGALHAHAADLVLDDVVLPLWRRTQSLASRLRATQHGRLHVYLVYVMSALLGLLAYLTMAGG